MYCANCGTQLVPGLSYCNRCGFNLKERTETNNRSLYAFLIAITVIGVTGMGILIGGSVTLRTEAGLSQELIGVFMLFTFLIVSAIELLLFRNLSKLTSTREHQTPMLPPPVHQDLRLPQHSTLGEPVPSVTENTTRTLEYERREQARR
jgi:hypothetical protein